jgi:hypothetical protein
MPVVAQPKHTYAVIVGINRYALGPGYDLDGPVEGACRFADWLHVQRTVPGDQIFLFLSPAPQDPAAVPSGITVSQATHHLHDFVTETLANKRGDLLVVYWCGHGIMTADGARRLLYADAKSGYERNLDLDALLTYLRSNQVPGFRQQIVLVDACADYVTAVEPGTTLADFSNPFAKGDLSSPHEQFVLVATKEGESANNLPEKRTGLFSQKVLELLNEGPTESWPPDMDGVFQRLQTEFADLRAKGKRRQTPTYFWHRNWEGSTTEDGYGFVTPDLQTILMAYLAVERQTILAGIRFRPVPLADAAADTSVLDFEAYSVPLRAVSRDGTKRPDHFDFDPAFQKWLTAGKGLIVLGKPGHGKSWLVARLALSLLARLAERLGSQPAMADVLPLRVTCWELSQEFLRPDAGSLPKAVAEITSRRLASPPYHRFRERFRQFVEEQFRRDAVFLVADGWDELARGQDDLLGERRAAIREQLGRWIAGVRRSRLLLTSRLVNYSGNLLPGAPEWELQPLSTEGSVLELVRKWYGPGRDRVSALEGAFDRHPQLREAARVPLFGALICWLAQDPSQPLPAQRTELLNTSLQVLFRRACKGAATDAQVTAVLNALVGLAYRTFRGGRWVISEEGLQEALTQGEPLTSSPADVQELLTGEFGLFTRAGIGDLEIVHGLFADLLCARGVVQAIIRPEADFAVWLTRHGGLRFLDPQWHEVWCHLAALLRDQPPHVGKELVAAMWAMHRRSRSAWRSWTGAPMDDLYGTALCLAGHCLAAAHGPWDTWPGKQIVNTLVADWIDYIKPLSQDDSMPHVTSFFELESALEAIGRAGHIQPLIRCGVDYRIEEDILFGTDDLTRLLKRIGPEALKAAREAREHAVPPDPFFLDRLLTNIDPVMTDPAVLEELREARERAVQQGRLGWLRFLWTNMRWSVFLFISFFLSFFVSPVLYYFIPSKLWLNLVQWYGGWVPLILMGGLFLGMLLWSKIARYQLVHDLFEMIPKIDDVNAFSSDALLMLVIPSDADQAADVREREAKVKWFARPPLRYRLQATTFLLRFRDPDRRIPLGQRLKAIWALLRLSRYARMLFAGYLAAPVFGAEYGSVAFFQNGEYCFFDSSSKPLAMAVPWPLRGRLRRLFRLLPRLILHVLLILGVVACNRALSNPLHLRGWAEAAPLI